MVAAIRACASAVLVVASACNLDTFGLSAGVTSEAMTSEAMTSEAMTSEAMTTGITVGPTTAEPTGTGQASASTGGGPVDGDPCDPWLPACPEGSKCAAYASDDGGTWDANKCVPAGGGTPGMGCLVMDASTSGVASCGVGAMCWDVDEMTLTGVCYAQCGGTPEAPSCPPGSACFSTNAGTINLCVGRCDPLVPEQCDGVCVYDSLEKQFICLSDASAGTQLGDSCEFINECPPGSTCDDPARSDKCDPQAAGCCLAFCDLSQPQKCPADELCEAYFADAGPGDEDIGVCVTPP